MAIDKLRRLPGTRREPDYAAMEEWLETNIDFQDVETLEEVEDRMHRKLDPKPWGQKAGILFWIDRKTSRYEKWYEAILKEYKPKLIRYTRKGKVFYRKKWTTREIGVLIKGKDLKPKQLLVELPDRKLSMIYAKRYSLKKKGLT